MGCWNRRPAPREQHEPRSSPTSCSSEGALPALRRRLASLRELLHGSALEVVEAGPVRGEEAPGLVAESGDEGGVELLVATVGHPVDVQRKLTSLRRAGSPARRAPHGYQRAATHDRHGAPGLAGRAPRPPPA